VRKAANLAIDRAGLTKLLGGMMMEGKGAVYPGHPWFARPRSTSSTTPRRPNAARRGGLQRDQEAQDQDRNLDLGLGPDAALPMNGVCAGELNAVGFDCTFEVMEWNALITFAFQPVTGEASTKGRHQRPSTSAAPRSIPTRPSCGLYHSEYVPPRGSKLGAAEGSQARRAVNKAPLEALDRSMAQAVNLFVDLARLSLCMCRSPAYKPPVGKNHNMRRNNAQRVGEKFAVFLGQLGG